MFEHESVSVHSPSVCYRANYDVPAKSIKQF